MKDVSRNQNIFIGFVLINVIHGVNTTILNPRFSPREKQRSFTFILNIRQTPVWLHTSKCVPSRLQTSWTIGTFDVAISPKCQGCSKAQIYTQNEDFAACCKGLESDRDPANENGKSLRWNQMWAVLEFARCEQIVAWAGKDIHRGDIHG